MHYGYYQLLLVSTYAAYGDSQASPNRVLFLADKQKLSGERWALLKAVTYRTLM